MSEEHDEPYAVATGLFWMIVGGMTVAVDRSSDLPVAGEGTREMHLIAGLCKQTSVMQIWIRRGEGRQSEVRNV